MPSMFATDDLGFNLDTAVKHADDYANSVGTGCIIIDTSGRVLHSTVNCKNSSCFCSRAASLLKGQQSCMNVHLYGSYQAERFGGKYVFFCPFGLVHWASPITSGGIIRGAILGGPVHMVEPDEFLFDEFLQKHESDHKSTEELWRAMQDIPLKKPDAVNSMSELLFIVAAHISDIQPSRYAEEREYLDQQSDISQYLQHIKTMGGDDSEAEAYPLEKEKELLSLISIGDRTGSQKLLNDILGHIFFQSGGNLDVMKARILELVVLLSRAALTGGADVEQIFGLNYKYLNQIHSFNSIEDLTYWVSKIMGRFTDCVFNLTDVKHTDIIYRAVDYVKKNYMKKLTLEDTASHVYLSPSYFSKVFKEEMKVNFNNYLNHIRIEMSKKLLLDDSIVLVEISNLVGFEDQSYFSKVFKKLTGVTPGKYRESRGNAGMRNNKNNIK